jgi:cytochrome c oxidase assembly protein subunit 15
MLWTALDLLWGRDGSSAGHAHLRAAAKGLSVLIFLMVLSGGFVAGIHAGLAYNTFPLMNGNWAPPEIFLLNPWYLNFFSNMATVQFDHRQIAWLLAILVPVFSWAALRAGLPGRMRALVWGMLVVLGIQLVLGVSTLLLAVPIPLAAAHQSGALLLFTLSLAVSRELA